MNHDGEEDCLPCLDGLFSNPGDAGCVSCAAGKTAGVTSCVDCVAGQVSSSDTGLKCAACEIGMYQNKPGLPSCVECIPGQYQNDEGKTKCKECQQGHYDAGVASIRDAPTVCKKCECKCFFLQKLLFSNTNTINLIHLILLILCSYFNHFTGPIGYMQKDKGSSYCNPCLTGAYQNALGGFVCKECPIGYSNDGSLHSMLSQWRY